MERDSVSRSKVDVETVAKNFCDVWIGKVAAGRRPALLSQRDCVIQPSVGAQRLRWVNRQMGNNSEGVVAMDGRGDATPSGLRKCLGR